MVQVLFLILRMLSRALSTKSLASDVPRDTEVCANEVTAASAF